jgi:ribokinase
VGVSVVVVVGSVNVDVVAAIARTPLEGETLPAERGWVQPGGKGANQAVAAARMGAPVRIVAAIGEDGLATTAESVLATLPVDRRIVRVQDAPTGMALIWVGPGGDNTIVLVSGANARLSPEHLRHLPTPDPDDVVLVSLEIPIETAVAAAQWARVGGAQLVVDPAPAPASMPAALWAADVLVPNHGEAERLLGQVIPPGQEVDAAHALVQRGAKTAVVKLGARGLVWANGETDGRVAPTPVAAVDTTGAGDAFAGALAAALDAGVPLEEAMRRASRVAAVACTRAGAQTAMPTWDEVLAHERGVP